MTAFWTIYVVLGTISGILAYGITLGYFQGKYPSVRGTNDIAISLVQAILCFVAPVLGLGVVFCLTSFCKYGFKYHAEGPTNKNYGYDIYGEYHL